MRPATDFHLVRRGAEPVPMSLVGERSVRTLEGRIARTPFARVGPAAAAFLVLAAAGETATALLHARLGIALHALALVALITHAALVRRVNPRLADLFVALTPVPLIRIVSLTSPLAEFSYVQWFSIIGVILYAGIVTSIKLLRPSLQSLGLRLPERRHWPLEALVIAGGIGFGWLEYQILEPGALVMELSARTLIAPILVLYVSTGLLEELLFRGLIQKYAGAAMGVAWGIAYTTLLFAVLHAGWRSWLDILFVGAVGLIYSLVVRRTGSIVGVSISHGLTNTMLFLVMPLSSL